MQISASERAEDLRRSARSHRPLEGNPLPRTFSQWSSFPFPAFPPNFPGRGARASRMMECGINSLQAEDAKAHFGTLDVVVPNAGYESTASSIADNQTEEILKTYTLNVFSPMWLIKLFAATALDKRYAKPEEVAAAVVMMASPKTAHTCGMEFNLDAIVPSC